MSITRDLKKEKPQYFYDVDQQTDRWFDMKLGKISGSTCSELLGAGKKHPGGLTAAAVTLAMTKAAEIITKENPYSFTNKYTERGNDLEPEAVDEYEEDSFNTVTHCGIITLGDYICYSPDGLIGENGLLEIKCPEQKEYLRILRAVKEDPEKKKYKDYISSSYYKQMQFGMMVTGREYCDHVYFHPKFKNKLITIRVERDEEMIENFFTKLPVFIDEVKTFVKADV